MNTNQQDGSQPTVVLVHGAWADGSGWRGVYDLLRQDGHEVRVVQNPTVSLQDDVAATKTIIGEHSDPVRRAERRRPYSAAAGRLPVARPGKVP